MQDILQNRPYLLFDGAMGTYFAERNATTGIKCEMANIEMPQEVLAIHREYIAAGAGAIKTNTFAANTAVLGCPPETVLDVVRRGWHLACEATGGSALVFADIGPIPEGAGGDAADEYRRIIDAFIALGARHFLFETFAEPGRVLEAARYIKSRADARIIASFAVHPDGHTRAGVSGAALASQMEASPDVDAWGFNCVSGPYYLNEYVRSLGARRKPLAVMPNAGYPAMLDGRTVYMHNAGYFARQMAEIHARGAAILGGCCGTTPEHIAQTAQALGRSPAPGRRVAAGAAAGAGVAVPNRFWEKLSAGGKVIAVEADPPQDAAIAPMLAGAAGLREAGADIVTVADSPLARARADSSMTAAMLARRCSVEAMPHLACRDRNLNAMKALLLALHIEGVRNVLAVTGDPVPAADRGEVKGVFDFNSQLLAAYIRDLNCSVFAGDPLRVGAALNINAANLDAELRRAERKAAQGAEFFLTQPAFSQDAIHALRAARERLGGKILAGIMPLVGHRNALFVANEIPGMRIPEGVVERFRNLKRAEAERLGVEIAAETAQAALPYVDGYFIITPLGRFEVSWELTRRIRSMTDDSNR